MAQKTVNAEDLLRDIYQAEAALRWFEQKYGLLSTASDLRSFVRISKWGYNRCKIHSVGARLLASTAIPGEREKS